ncbi:MAG: DNA repair protein RadC [Deltaproteobacteria bacterium]|nr:DNA repair protein RadC [Deltaproteobacteria bacterium]
MPPPNAHAFYHVRLVKEGRPFYSAPITSPGEAAPFFQTRFGQAVEEHFAALFLNARNVPLGWREISRGSVSASIVHPREVFLPAIQLASSSLILAHNHPSTDVTPSSDDIELTRRLVKAGELMGIEVLDHLIITQGEYLSLKERGLM